MTETRDWYCPACGRATPTCYRCANYDCGKDLAGLALERVNADD